MINREKVCSHCTEIRKLDDFYRSYGKLDTDGRMRVCKRCIKKLVNPNNVETLLEVLRMVDKPFIYHLFESSKSKTDVVGEYFKLVNAKDFRQLTSKDSLFMDDSKEDESETSKKSEEVKKYSSKWIGDYTDLEIEYLDNYLNGLNKDFKIVTENHKDYARKIAKASFHMDKCFSDVLDGINGAEKKYKDAKDVFDALSKSAQFSESQRGQNEVGLGCFGRVFELVESRTYIPEHIPLEKDDVDKIIDDFSHIKKSL